MKKSHRPRALFKDTNLPDPDSFTAHRNITLPKESLLRFRESYGKLVAFASIVCNVEPEKLCEMDLTGYAWKTLKARQTRKEEKICEAT